MIERDAIERDPVAPFLWWSAVHQGLFRGYGLAMLIYVVVEADLEPLQLVLLGTALEVAVLLAEIPTGVVADTLSRKRSIVISQVIMGIAFACTGLTTEFVPLLLTQVAWGVGWTFTSGADIAWITDELNDPSRIDRVLAARARWMLSGSVVGLVVSGMLGVWLGLDVAMIVFGLTLCLLGGFVAVAFTEHNFSPVRENRPREAREIFSRVCGSNGPIIRCCWCSARRWRSTAEPKLSTVSSVAAWSISDFPSHPTRSCGSPSSEWWG